MAHTCKACGGNCSEYGFGKYKCSWCGHKYTEQDFLETGNVFDLETFSLLNKARLAIEIEYDFKKSLKYSQSVLEKNPFNREANWLALIAESRIIYLQNDKAKYVPTFLDPESACLTKSKYYKTLDPALKSDADAIEKIRIATIEEFKKVKPYDIFISYKQHDGDSASAETKEAIWARDIYTELKTNPKTRGLNVFFDQKCLSGANVGWEPHIFSAIKSSKCMIVLGSSLENINSRWVKNEWKRFISLKEGGDKKDFIVLGSENVNPLLLDEKLQEKQMISNTSGKWISEIVNRVVQICGKPEKEKPEPLPKLPKKKRKINKKLVAIIAACLCFVVVGAGVGIGVPLKISADKINETIALIEYIPDYEITDYTLYEQIIGDALDKYNALSESQKKKVDNRDKLLNTLDGFNNYRIETLRLLATAVTAESVSETDDLERAVTLYAKLTTEQKGMLMPEERANLDNLVKVYSCITSINEVKGDVIGKYDEIENVNRIYLSLTEHYKALVYNYGLVPSFAEQYAFYSNLEFAEVDGGYSVSLKDGVTVTGNVQLPSRYNGQNVVSIPENAFADCKGITSLTVPDTVMQIGAGAFKGCNNIENIILPFVGKSENAGGDYKTGYEAVFGWIFGYEYLRVSTSFENYNVSDYVNTPYGESNNGAIWQYTWHEKGSYNHNTYYYFIPQTIKIVTITKQTDIPLAAFNGCRNLTAVEYKSEVNNLYGYAFQNCESLERFNSDIAGLAKLPEYTETIGEYAFAECKVLTALNIPESIHVFEEHAFENCRQIRELNLTDRVNVIGDYAFAGLSLIKDVTVYNSTVYIGCGAFKGCNNIENIILPFVGKSENAGGDYKIGYEAVFGWIFGYEYLRVSTSFENYNVSDYVNTPYGESDDGSIWQYTWHEKGSYNHNTYYYFIPQTIKTVTITKQTDIPLAGFNGCNMLAHIYFTNKIISIGDYAFQNCVQPEVVS